MEQQDADLLLENAYIETKEFLAGRGDTPLVDSDVLSISDELKINLVSGALTYVNRYGGTSDFIHNLKTQLVKKGMLSIPQIRAALNVMMKEIAQGKIEVVRRTGEVEPIAIAPVQAEGPLALPTDEYVPSEHFGDHFEPSMMVGIEVRDALHTAQCYKCKRWFESVRVVVEHKKSQCKGYGKPVETKSVMDESKVEKTFLDISGLPDGRYAVLSPDPTKQYLFLSVRTVKRAVHRTRRYAWSKFTTGSEYIPVGTVEVREWSQDAKRLCGMQRPGQGYEGEFVEQLITAMSAPKVWAMIFSKFIGCCSICGKTLTDDDSRERGIGPECVKKWGMDYWTKFARPVPPTA